MPAEALEPEDIKRRVARYQIDAARAQVAESTRNNLYARPLAEAAFELVEAMSSTVPRIDFGLAEIDADIRGIGPGELCYLTGKSHSGKTQLITHMIRSRPKGRFLYFTPDETKALVLCRLVGQGYDIDAERLEARIKAGDERAAWLVYKTAIHDFPNLIVIEQALDFTQMSVALHEAMTTAWDGQPPECVFVDYLDQLPGPTDYNGTKRKSVELKNWTKRHRVPVVCIHQPNRSVGRGERIGMDQLSNAGDTEATYVCGVWRIRDDPYHPERYMHQDTVTIGIDKNKRPPCRTGTYTFFLHPDTGALRSLRPEDMVAPGQPITSVETAAAVIERTRSRRTTGKLDKDDVIDLALVRAQREQP